jgi:hypothetical protein
MTLFLAGLVLLGLCVTLMWGAFAVLRSFMERDGFGDPSFREQGPIFHDYSVEHEGARSQFVWQSRSHFQGPD